MSFIFNTFILYCLFNQVNCRIINDKLNIFKRITKDYMFILVALIELGIQILLVMYGSKAFHCVNGGLSLKQWGLSFGFAFISFIISFIGKLIPLDKQIDPCIKPKRNIEDEVKYQQRITVSEMLNHSPFIY